MKNEWNGKKMKWIKNKLKFGSKQHNMEVWGLN